MNARRSFIVCSAAAAPGVLWQAFEMYGLTLRGSQMLFFTIAHVMPPLLILVALALPFMAALVLQSLTALAMDRYRRKLGLSALTLTLVAATVTAQGVALWTYGTWSVNSNLRVPVCLLGIASLGITISRLVIDLLSAKDRQRSVSAV